MLEEMNLLDKNKTLHRDLHVRSWWIVNGCLLSSILRRVRRRDARQDLQEEHMKIPSDSSSLATSWKVYRPHLSLSVLRNHRGRGLTVFHKLCSSLTTGKVQGVHILFQTYWLKRHPGNFRYFLGIEVVSSAQRFRCGGLVLGVTTHHKVCDGQSMAAFYVALGQAVRGVPIDPIPVDDFSLLTSRVSDISGFPQWNLDFVPNPPDEAGFNSDKNHAIDWDNITNVLVHFPWEFINTKLKPLLKGKKHSTFETLMAHVWRKTTAARRMNGYEYTMLRISVNGRRRLEPAVPREFFGNLVLFGHCKATAEALLHGELGFAAILIHEAILRTDGRHFQSILDMPASKWKEEEEEHVTAAVSPTAAEAAPLLDADSLLGLGFEEVEFGGGGRLCGLLPGWVPIEGIVQLLPSLRKDGGIDVLVTLLEEHAQRFREISHSID